MTDQWRKKKTGSRGIEWCDITNNPIGGCKHNCRWVMPDGNMAICYAEDLAENGFAKRAYSEGFAHHYWRPHMLKKLRGMKTPNLVFINSMSDLFGCYDDETEILTLNGWKFFGDLDDRDEVAYLHDGKELKFTAPSKIYKYQYSGKMYRVKTKLVDLVVTPNHNLYVSHNPTTVAKRRKNVREFGLHRADETIGRQVYYKRDMIWSGDIGLVAENNTFGIDIDTWMKFMGYYISEGSASARPKQTKPRIQIASSPNGKSYKGVFSTLTGVCHHRNLNLSSYSDRFVIYGDNELASYLRTLGHAHEKYIPKWMKGLPPEKLNLLLNSLIEGDGCYTSDNVMSYYTSSKKLADDVHEIAHKCGYVASLSSRDRRDEEPSVMRSGRMIKHTRISYQVIISLSKKTRVTEVNLKRIKTRNSDTVYSEDYIDYDGFVYCVEVPTGVVYVRRNGHSVWCGNSWVPKDHIKIVLDTIRACPQHTFQALTKNAPGILKWADQIPQNLWVGVSSPPDFMWGKELTQSQKERMLSRQLAVFDQLPAHVVRWMSIEPLSWDIHELLINHRLDWAVIGAATNGRKKYQPNPYHVQSLLDLFDLQSVPTFFKGNLDWEFRLEDFPVVHGWDQAVQERQRNAVEFGWTQNRLLDGRWESRQSEIKAILAEGQLKLI